MTAVTGYAPRNAFTKTAVRHAFELSQKRWGEFKAAIAHGEDGRWEERQFLAAQARADLMLDAL